MSATEANPQRSQDGQQQKHRLASPGAQHFDPNLLKNYFTIIDANKELQNKAEEMRKFKARMMEGDEGAKTAPSDSQANSAGGKPTPSSAPKEFPETKGSKSPKESAGTSEDKSAAKSSKSTPKRGPAGKSQKTGAKPRSHSPALSAKKGGRPPTKAKNEAKRSTAAKQRATKNVSQGRGRSRSSSPGRRRRIPSKSPSNTRGKSPGALSKKSPSKPKGKAPNTQKNPNKQMKPRSHSPAANKLRSHSPAAKKLRSHSPATRKLRSHSPAASKARSHSPAAKQSKGAPGKRKGRSVTPQKKGIPSRKGRESSRSRTRSPSVNRKKLMTSRSPKPRRMKHASHKMESSRDSLSMSSAEHLEQKMIQKHPSGFRESSSEGEHLKQRSKYSSSPARSVSPKVATPRSRKYIKFDVSPNRSESPETQEFRTSTPQRENLTQEVAAESLGYRTGAPNLGNSRQEASPARHRNSESPGFRSGTSKRGSSRQHTSQYDAPAHHGSPSPSSGSGYRDGNAVKRGTVRQQFDSHSDQYGPPSHHVSEKMHPAASPMHSHRSYETTGRPHGLHATYSDSSQKYANRC